jgi:hypothetical protein
MTIFLDMICNMPANALKLSALAGFVLKAGVILGSGPQMTKT